MLLASFPTSPCRTDLMTSLPSSSADRRLTTAAAGRHPRPSLAVRLSGVAVDIEHTPVLQGVDFLLERGEVVGVIGANGSGKSTVLEVLSTLRKPKSGTGFILGADVRSTAPAELRRQICLVGHQPALYAQMSLQENLRFVADLFDRPVGAVDDALDTVGLTRSAERRVDRCSHGMARRADLARALITEPQLLLLDEAHAGLDPAAADLVAYLVSTVVAHGGSAVVVSHERERLASVVDRVVQVEQGRVLPVGEST